MTTPVHAHRSATIRSRLLSAARNSEKTPEFAVAKDDTEIWNHADSTSAAVQALGAGAVLVEYLIGFHGLHPDDAFFEAASLPPAEQLLRAKAAWQDVHAIVAGQRSTRHIGRTDLTSPHL
jgi:hypothetical protein